MGSLRGAFYGECAALSIAPFDYFSFDFVKVPALQAVKTPVVIGGCSTRCIQHQKRDGWVIIKAGAFRATENRRRTVLGRWADVGGLMPSHR